jgi:glycerophosphoryl diester phosphodiesterase
MINLPKLIGHRGVKNLSPENTLNSIELAYNLGLKWVEIDVKSSKDLVPILLHDDTLDRTTNGKGVVRNFNYDEIFELDAGSFFYNYPTNIHIPTLKETILFCSKNNVGINIELKPNLGFEKSNVKAIIEVLNNFNSFKSYYFSSFDWDSIVLIKKLLPNSFCGILIDEFNKNISLKNAIELCNKNNFFCIGFNKDILSSDIVDQMKKNNLTTNVYSEKNFKTNEAHELWSLGVKSIFIDDPSKFKIS